MEKPIDKVDWTKEMVYELIDIWGTFDCLYNPGSKFSHNKHARYEAFEKISEKLQIFCPSISINDVKVKMSYLRSQFCREKQKIKEASASGAGTDDLYQPTAYWYEKMKFIEPFVKLRKGKNNLQQNYFSSTEDEQTCDEGSSTPDQVPPPPAKKMKIGSSSSVSTEDDVLQAATLALEHISNRVVNAHDEAFIGFVGESLKCITNDDLKDELAEKITLLVFDYKRKQKALDRNLVID